MISPPAGPMRPAGTTGRDGRRAARPSWPVGGILPGWPPRVGRRARHGLLRPAALLLAVLAAGTGADAGHESAFYPSFYPREIRIEAMDPAAAAAAALQENALHAYIGADPFAGATPPANVGAMESLGSFVLITFNPASPAARSRQSRCGLARRMLVALSDLKEHLVFHPYPVTPFHPDYLAHADLAQAWKQPALDLGASGRVAGDPTVRIKAPGRLGESLARARWTVAEGDWDVAIEERDVADLMAPQATSFNGWLGPPWLKEGWFQAHLLLGGAIKDPPRARRIADIARRLAGGAYDGPADKFGLERTLVTLLTQGCERVVAGYTSRRVTLNTDYNQGVENVAIEAIGGAVAPIFVRTIKLKDFPWNGSIRVGVGGGAAAAWNPMAGFTDPLGRLLWFTVGDPAMVPAPSNGSWIPGRVTPTVAPGGAGGRNVAIPPDALLPDAAGTQFRAVGPGRAARAKVLYRVPLSLFHDGTRMTVADLMYPYAFAQRWGTKRRDGAPGYDPAVAEATALARQWVAGLRVGKTERIVRDLGGGVRLEWQVPAIEVYLHHATLDPQQAAAAAPPWSSLPWHLVALMEDAVLRGGTAFSAQEARRLGVPWLDLVRDGPLLGRLAARAEEFERTAFVPEALKALVRPEEARQRWAALRQFHQKHHHLLVTNGPYRLEKWTADAAALQVFRDTSYPLGIGTFDPSVLPPKARILSAEVRGLVMHVTVEMEKAVRAARGHTLVREGLTKDATTGGYPVQARCRYLVLGSDGKVRRAGVGRQGADGSFRLDLAGLGAGSYTILTAVDLNGNTVDPDVRAVPYRPAR